MNKYFDEFLSFRNKLISVEIDPTLRYLSLGNIPKVVVSIVGGVISGPFEILNLIT